MKRSKRCFSGINIPGYDKIINPVLIIIFLLISSAVLFTGCKEDSPAGTGQNDVKTEVEGAWSGIEISGAAGSWKFNVSGKSASITATYPVMSYSGNISVDTTTNPRRLDLDITVSTITEYIGTKSLGIYKISGDTLYYAAGEPGVTFRPRGFVGTSTSRVFILLNKP